MKAVSVPVFLLVFVSVSWAGWSAFIRPGSYVIGGEYTVPRGEVVRGDLQVLFAQVTLEQGARVDGGITAISSTLDVAGSVGGSVFAIGSDITRRATAQLAADPESMNGMPFVLLLPHLARTGYAASISR